MELKIIARVYGDFPTKFGIPRQSSLVESLRSRLIFEPEYRVADALRGLEGYDRLWLIWSFDGTERDHWSPTVRPPRLGGNVRMGVFATRSPFRPNPLGLSCVKLEHIEPNTPDGPVLHLLGADLMDGTAVYDIKPYLPHTESWPDARGGFAQEVQADLLTVEIPQACRALIPADRLDALMQVLQEDPRPRYQNDPDRVYGFPFAGREIRFRVAGQVLTVCEVTYAVEKP